MKFNITASDIKITAQHRKLATEIQELRTFLQGLPKDPVQGKYPQDLDAAKIARELLSRLQFFFSNLEKLKRIYSDKLRDFNSHSEEVQLEDFREITEYRRRVIRFLRSIFPHLEAILAFMQKGMNDVRELNAIVEELKRLEERQAELREQNVTPWKEETLEEDKALVASRGTIPDSFETLIKISEVIEDLHILTY